MTSVIVAMHAMRDRIDEAWAQAVAAINSGQAVDAVKQLQALQQGIVQLRDDTLKTKLLGLPRIINPMLDETDLELKIAASKAVSNPSVDEFQSVFEAFYSLRMELDSVRWQLIQNEPETLP